MSEIKYSHVFLRNLPDVPVGMVRLMGPSGVLRDLPEDDHDHLTNNGWRVIAEDQTQWLTYLFNNREWERTKDSLSFYDREFLREIGVSQSLYWDKRTDEELASRLKAVQ